MTVFFFYAVYVVSMTSSCTAEMNQGSGEINDICTKRYIFIELNFSQFTATNFQKTNLKALAVLVTISVNEYFI